MTSNFEKVVHFNEQFAVIPSKILTPNPSILKQDPQMVEFCLKLIREEVKELEQAVQDNDYIEVVDGLADITYVVFGLAARIGINLVDAFSLVHENNMSKLCKTEEEAQLSVSYYENNGAVLGYDSPNYRRAPDGIHWVVYNASTKKILKSIKWKPVDLSSVCK